MARRFEKAKEYTQKYKSVLLPCRVCGNTDIRIVSDRAMFPPRDVWGVICTTPKCDCIRPRTSVRESVRAWNERASIPYTQIDI